MKKEVVCQIDLITKEAVTIENIPLEEFKSMDLIPCGITQDGLKNYISKYAIKNIYTKEIEG
jgi:hypothetical protein